MTRALLLACAILCGIGTTAAQAQSYTSWQQLANAPQRVTSNYRQSTLQSYSPSTTTTAASNSGFDMSTFSAPNGTNLYPNTNSYSPTANQPLNTVNQAAVRARYSNYNPVEPLSGVDRAIRSMQDGSFFSGAPRAKM